MISEDPLLTSAEAAELLRVTVGTLEQWRGKGAGPRFVRIGAGNGRIRFRRSDIDSFVADRVVEPS